MKTLLLISHKMNLGGTEKALLSFINSLKNKNLVITLLLLEKGGVLESSIPDFVKVAYFDGFEEIKPIIENPPIHTITEYFNKAQLGKALQMLKTYGQIKSTGNWHHIYERVLKNRPKFGEFDIAVAFAGPSDFISYFVAKKVTAKKKIQWIHFDIEKVITNYNFGKKFYPFFDQIFCVSQSSKDIFLKKFPQFEHKTDVFHNIVSVAEIQRSAAEGVSFADDYKGIRILTVGRFTKEKGQHLIPEVVAKLKADGLDFRWYLVGDGKERTSVEEKSEELGVSEHIIFLGERENPYPFMKDCTIYVQPSLHEGYGITVAEAQVFNKPIVVTNFASAKDLIEHNKTGIITSISSEGLYPGVKSLLLNFDLQRKLSENSINQTRCDGGDISKLLN